MAQADTRSALVWDTFYYPIEKRARARWLWESFPVAYHPLIWDTFKYSPDQAREPAGTAIGGRFAGGGVPHWGLTEEEEEAEQERLGAKEEDEQTPWSDRIDWRVSEDSVLAGKKDDIIKMFAEFADIPDAKLQVRSGVIHEGDATVVFWAPGKYSVSRHFYKNMSNELTVRHADFELPIEAQGKGVAKRFLSASMDAYEKWGVKEVNLSANINVGGYAWAKYGFAPESAAEWKTVLRVTETTIGELRTKGSMQLNDALVKIQVRGDKKSIWELADLTEQVDGEAAGKTILLNTNWGGRLRLTDKAAMARFNKYTGRVAKYSPDQPREPAGQPTGGRFAGGGPAFPLSHISWQVSPLNKMSGTQRLIQQMFAEFTEVPGAQLMVEDSGDNSGLVLTFWSNEVTGYDIRREILEQDGEITAYHSNFELPESEQGEGVGKRFLADSMDVYEKLGVQSVWVGANIKVGGYAWAKYGFLPTKDSWERKIKPHVRDIMGMSVMADASDEQRAHIESFFDDDPRTVWAIADMSTGSGEGRSLGKTLLKGTSWQGSINLNDEDQMKRFNRYTGRVKKYSPDQPRNPAGTPEGGRFTSSKPDLGYFNSLMRGVSGVSEPNAPPPRGQAGGEAMRDHVTLLASMGMKNMEFFRDHGQVYAIDDKTFIGGKPQMCYMNTFNAVLNHDERDLTYVEGYMSVHGVPIHHAFAVTKDGKVRDYTIKDKDKDKVQGYFGVPLRNNFVSLSALKTKYYGVTTHNNWKNIFETDPQYVVKR